MWVVRLADWFEENSCTMYEMDHETVSYNTLGLMTEKNGLGRLLAFFHNGDLITSLPLKTWIVSWFGSNPQHSYCCVGDNWFGSHAKNKQKSHMMYSLLWVIEFCMKMICYFIFQFISAFFMSFLFYVSSFSSQTRSHGWRALFNFHRLDYRV